MVLNIYIARRRTYYCSSPHDVQSRAIYTCVMCLLDVAHCISVQCLLAYISHLHAASWSAQQSQSWQHLDVQWPTANWPSWHRWNQDHCVPAAAWWVVRALPRAPCLPYLPFYSSSRSGCGASLWPYHDQSGVRVKCRGAEDPPNS